MFQVSRRADYALRIMIELGVVGERKRLPAREISRSTGVPKAFLHKITADLVKAGLVRTYSGPQGGLALAKTADQINMLHIVEAVEGPIYVNICLIRPQECPRDRICPGHNFWDRLQSNLVQQLTDASLADLAAEAQLLRKKPQTRQEPAS